MRRKERETAGGWGPTLLLGMVALIGMGASCWVQAASVTDRSEREPGDRDRGDGFVGVRRYSNKARELEPGDAAGRGDFTPTDSLDDDTEPADGGDTRPSDRREPRAQNKSPNAVQPSSQRDKP